MTGETPEVRSDKREDREEREDEEEDVPKMSTRINGLSENLKSSCISITLIAHNHYLKSSCRS